MKAKDLHKKPGFKVPEGYFDSFEATLFEKTAQENNLPKDDGYRIPKDYFETFDDSLLRKLKDKKGGKLIALATYKKVYYTLAAAAAVLLLFIAVKNSLPASGESLYDISSADVEVYIDNGYVTLNSYDIAEVFDDTAIDITSMTEDGIDDENLIDYLHENLDNYNDLMIEN